MSRVFHNEKVGEIVSGSMRKMATECKASKESVVIQVMAAC